MAKEKNFLTKNFEVPYFQITAEQSDYKHNLEQKTIKV